MQYEGAHGVPCEVPRHGTHPHHRGIGWDGLQPDKSAAEFACKDQLNRSRPSARSCDGIPFAQPPRRHSPRRGDAPVPVLTGLHAFEPGGP